MEGRRQPVARGNGGRTYEIVNGKAYSVNQLYVTRPRASNRRTVRSTYTLSAPAPSSHKSWIFNDPEIKRKKRVVKYKLYAVEGKVKESLKKGLRWIKNKCSKWVRRGP